MWPFSRPSSNCLERALSPAALNHAWLTIEKDRGCWVRGVPLAQVKRDIVRHLGDLADDVRHGRYRPDPMACHEIPKADGGKRLISVSTLRDRVLQRAVMAVLEPLGEAIFSDIAYPNNFDCSKRS